MTHAKRVDNDDDVFVDDDVPEGASSHPLVCSVEKPQHANELLHTLLQLIRLHLQDL